MTEDVNEVPQPRPTITITFAGPGLADFTIEASDEVQPAQVYGAAFMFDQWAHEIRIQILAGAARAAEARGGIVVPVNRQMRRHPDA